MFWIMFCTALSITWSWQRESTFVILASNSVWLFGSKSHYIFFSFRNHLKYSEVNFGNILLFFILTWQGRLSGTRQKLLQGSHITLSFPLHLSCISPTLQAPSIVTLGFGCRWQPPGPITHCFRWKHWLFCIPLLPVLIRFNF